MGAFRYMFNDALHNRWNRDAYLQKQANLRAKMEDINNKSLSFKMGLSNLSSKDKVIWEERMRIGKLQYQHMQEHNLHCTCGPTSNQVGLALSVGALVTPGGWGYAMGTAAIALDLAEPDYTGALIGAFAMTPIRYMWIFDIGYGIKQVGEE